MTCVVTIRGLPDIPSITEVNVRDGAGTNFNQLFKAPVGMGGLTILDIQPDSEGKQELNKVYQWFQLQFADGKVGWVRDDLLFIEGDCEAWGYPNLSEQRTAFELTRDVAREPEPEPIEPTVDEPEVEVETVTFQADGQVRVRSLPSLRGEHLRWLDDGERIECDANSRTEADGYVWYQHAGGWSAEGAVDGRMTFLVDVATLPEVPSISISDGQEPPIISSQAGFGDIDRVRKASFAITIRFEGLGYKAYNNYDSGIVSYGIIQFTLASGSLVTVIQRYLANSQSDTANQLRGLLPRIEARSEDLRHDATFKNLLMAAADEPEMQTAQESVATENYWDKVWNGYIVHRGLQTPLGWALLFDMGVNFGTGHGFVRLAEEQLGVPQRSRPGQNGITEEQLIAQVALLRKQSHDRQAERDNLPGLRVRGDFWVDLINRGDWGLQGDGDGFVVVNGQRIQVREP